MDNSTNVDKLGGLTLGLPDLGVRGRSDTVGTGDKLPFFVYVPNVTQNTDILSTNTA